MAVELVAMQPRVWAQESGLRAAQMRLFCRFAGAGVTLAGRAVQSMGGVDPALAGSAAEPVTRTVTGVVSSCMRTLGKKKRDDHERAMDLLQPLRCQVDPSSSPFYQTLQLTVLMLLECRNVVIHCWWDFVATMQSYRQKQIVEKQITDAQIQLLQLQLHQLQDQVRTLTPKKPERDARLGEFSTLQLEELSLSPPRRLATVLSLCASEDSSMLEMPEPAMLAHAPRRSLPPTTTMNPLMSTFDKLSEVTTALSPNAKASPAAAKAAKGGTRPVHIPPPPRNPPPSPPPSTQPGTKLSAPQIKKGGKGGRASAKALRRESPEVSQAHASAAFSPLHQAAVPDGSNQQVVDVPRLQLDPRPPDRVPSLTDLSDFADAPRSASSPEMFSTLCSSPEVGRKVTAPHEARASIRASLLMNVPAWAAEFGADDDPVAEPLRRAGPGGNVATDPGATPPRSRGGTPPGMPKELEDEWLVQAAEVQLSPRVLWEFDQRQEVVINSPPATVEQFTVHSKVRATLLRALGFPGADVFAVEDGGSYRKLIVWLEDTKIRFYKPEERKELRATGAHAAWEAAFEKYLREMGCEWDPTPEQRGMVLDWLLRQAVAYEYRDNAESISTMAAKLAPPPAAQSPAAAQRSAKAAPSGSSSSMPNFSATDTPEFQHALENLAQLLSVPVMADRVALLKAVLSAAQRKLSPAALEAASAMSLQQEKGGGNKSEHNMFGMPTSLFPLGFSLDDPQLEAVATLLRVLHVNDLRHLQTQVDHLIVEMQEYTADPKTDAKLGRVGV